MIKTAKEMKALAQESTENAQEKAKNDALRLLTTVFMPAIERAAKEGYFTHVFRMHPDVDFKIISSMLNSLGYEVCIKRCALWVSWE